MSLKRKAIGGSVVAVGTYGIGQAVRLVGNVILAHLLFKEAFGLMAIVTSVSIGFAMLSDIGLGQIVIQSPRGEEPGFLNTIWTLHILRAIVMCAVMLAIAYPVASYYAQNDPHAWELLKLLPMVAVANLITETKSIGYGFAARNLEVWRTSSIELASQVGGVVVMILVAWRTRSVLSLAAGVVAQGLITSALSHVIFWGRTHRFQLEKRTVAEVRNFSRWIFFSTALTFVASQVDRLVFGRFFSLDLVGLYSIAAGIASLVPMLMSRLGGAVLLPMYSRVLARDGHLKGVFVHAAGPAVTITSYIITLMIAGAPAFVALLYDQRYSGVAPFIQILAAGCWFSCVDTLYSQAFVAANLVRYVLIVNLAKVAAFIGLLCIAVHFRSMPLAVLSVALSEAARLATSLSFSRVLSLGGFAVRLRSMALMLAIGVAAVAFAYWLDTRLPGHPLWILVLVLLAVTACYARRLMTLASTVRAASLG